MKFSEDEVVVIPNRWSRLEAFGLDVDLDITDDVVVVVVVVVNSVLIIVVVVVVGLKVNRVWAPRDGQCRSVTHASCDVTEGESDEGRRLAGESGEQPS